MNVFTRTPILGWLIAAAVCAVVAVPIFFLWNWLAPIYFYWLPPVYLSIPYVHVFGLLWLISSLKGLMLPKIGTTVNNNMEEPHDGVHHQSHPAVEGRR